MSTAQSSSDGQGALDVSVVVPVYNAKTDLERLVGEVFALAADGVTCELIFVDDCSTDGSREEITRLADLHDNIVPLLLEENGGAGVARNEGWAHVTGRFTIFFDADDVFHAEAVAPTLKAMEAGDDVDVALLGYLYERDEQKTDTTMSEGDRELMTRYLKGGKTRVGTLDEMSSLLLFTNYPWNKIIRTAHFKTKDLRYGATKVHNDVLGHWLTLLGTRKILLSEAVLCTHIVHASGGNLTNRSSRVRFEAFRALHELLDVLEENPFFRYRYSHIFWTFVKQLTDWARPRVPRGLRSEFNKECQRVARRMTVDELATLRTKRNPALGKSLVKLIFG